MEDSPEPDAEEDGPPPRPSAFGLDAEPAGCSLVAGLGFAALMAPFVFMPPGSLGCVETADGCVPVGQDLAADVAVTALLGAAFAGATALLIGGRLRAWREGRRVRPPLWAGFVALLVLGWAGMGIAIVPLMLLVQKALA
jgi:hypothetical protein